MQGGFDKELTSMKNSKCASESKPADQKAIEKSCTSPISSTPADCIITFAGYDWRVLEVQKNNKALLLSEKVLERRAYNEQENEITWEQCTLRSYLNGAFYESLGTEKSEIIDSCIVNASNPWLGTAGGNNTIDKIFLLSLEEVVQYFGDSGQLKYKNPKSKYWIDDQYNAERKAYDADGKVSWWWLRSPGIYSFFAGRVSADGNIHLYGNYVHLDSGGVRPALWVKL